MSDWKRSLALGMAPLVCLLGLTGCTKGRLRQAANKVTLSLDGVAQISLAYDEEELTFFVSDGEELVIQEFMTEDKDRYHARVDRHGGVIEIKEGGKPVFHNGFSRSVEAYLPESYRQSLTVTSTDGAIDLSQVPLTLSALRVDSTAGMVEIGQARADDIHLSSTSGTLALGCIQGGRIRLETTSGQVTCDQLVGSVTYTSTSGDAQIKSAAGSGSYRANNSGKLAITYTEVTGDLSLYNKNGRIELTLPIEPAVQLEASTKTGVITTPFQDLLKSDARSVSGAVGDHPTVTVTIQTKNGDIQVSQK